MIVFVIQYVTRRWISRLLIFAGIELSKHCGATKPQDVLRSIDEKHAYSSTDKLVLHTRRRFRKQSSPKMQRFTARTIPTFYWKNPHTFSFTSGSLWKLSGFLDLLALLNVCKFFCDKTDFYTLRC